MSLPLSDHLKLSCTRLRIGTAHITTRKDIVIQAILYGDGELRKAGAWQTFMIIKILKVSTDFDGNHIRKTLKFTSDFVLILASFYDLC